MRILLDVCTPVQVRQALVGHDVNTAARLGWRHLGDGELLQAAEVAGFDVFIICDKNLRYQQNLRGRRLAVLELWTNHRPTLEEHFAVIRRAVEALHPGEYRALGLP